MSTRWTVKCEKKYYDYWLGNDNDNTSFSSGSLVTVEKQRPSPDRGSRYNNNTVE